jgi:hypothetical protein
MNTQSIGRPTVMTEIVVQKLEKALREGFSVDMACHLSGISRSTYYSHLDSNAEFSYKMELAQEWVTQRAKQVVATSIEAGDLKAAQWWLERKARAEFANNQQQQTTPQEDPFKKMEPEEFYAFLERAIGALNSTV